MNKKLHKILNRWTSHYITEDEAIEDIKQLFLDIVREVKPKGITENAQEDQSVAESVYYEQQKNIGFNMGISLYYAELLDILES